MANDLQIYLVSKYMSGPKAVAILATKDQGSKKKSKKKQKAHEDRNHSTNNHFGLILRDADDESSWKLGNEEDELQPVWRTS
ncbi:hypothetical protein O181_072039 [Austropuccinia psidii MF-1]|uniref:Uncharacterized protein n=1 Tax=Austropuccinia psidii MF-1 TaxID=1389203 RepID=A0A9Q3F4E6_9BASI|nr:hypothetical protein [Austropuccinia psidii MF-1]